jgi:4-amino-4-deoxy-L-arabinose transferase-like glycosyltransferase
MVNQEKLLKWTLIVSVVIMFFSLGHRALWDPDESRYAEIAREILVLHDWVTPHLNFLLYFEKPMMFMWLEAVSFKLFGISESSAHVIPLLTALGGAALVGLMAWKLWGRRSGLIASLILVTSLMYFFLACAVDINMPLTLFITSAMVFFWLGHSEKKTGYFLISWASMALAVLTKGPIGIMLPAGAICLYILLSRQFSLIKESKPISGILLFLVVTLPWYILVCLRNPDFFSFFFVNQNLQRFAVSHEHNQPFFYFFLVILGGALPWTLLLPSAIKELWHKTMPKEILYILVWFSLIFFFFMPSKSKLATYILPCFPPISLILAYTLKASPKKGGWPLYAACILWACLGIPLMFFPILASHGVNLSSTGVAPIIQEGPMLSAIILSGVFIGAWLGRKFDVVAGLAVLSISLMIIAIAFSPQWDARRSTKYLVEDLPASAKLFAYRDYNQSSTFYSKRQVGMVESKGELAFGINHNRTKGVIITLDELAALMNSSNQVFCVTKLKNKDELQKKIPKLAVVRQSDKLCLLNAGN